MRYRISETVDGERRELYAYDRLDQAQAKFDVQMRYLRRGRELLLDDEDGRIHAYARHASRGSIWPMWLLGK